MAEFNGHKNWNYWNVSLWLGNDESLYRAAVRYKRHSGDSRKAAKLFKQDYCLDRTPDGAPFSVSAIAAFMRHE